MAAPVSRSDVSQTPLGWDENPQTFKTLSSVSAAVGLVAIGVFAVSVVVGLTVASAGLLPLTFAFTSLAITFASFGAAAVFQLHVEKLSAMQIGAEVESSHKLHSSNRELEHLKNLARGITPLPDLPHFTSAEDKRNFMEFAEQMIKMRDAEVIKILMTAISNPSLNTEDRKEIRRSLRDTSNTLANEAARFRDQIRNSEVG